MGITNADLDQVTIDLPFDGVVSAVKHAIRRVPFRGTITNCVGTLLAGTGTTTLELNKLPAGVVGSEVVVGTVNAVKTVATAMALTAANQPVDEGDYIGIDCTAAGTTPIGGNLAVTIKRKFSS